MRKRGWRWLVAAVVAAGGFVLSFHPSRPLYMSQESSEIVSPQDGTVLAGTLSLPRWSRKPVPAVVLVHGSGRLGREHLLGDTRRLVWEGIGVLAYDKRGVGASGGVYPQAGESGFDAILRLLARDAAAAFEQLRRSPGVDPSRLGFFGASQAGWIVPLAAEQLNPQPRFHVFISGPAVSTGVEAHYSRLTGDGSRPPEISDRSEIRTQVESFAGPAGFDPAPILSSQSVPTLWLLGERDESVPTFASVRVLDAIHAAGNQSHRVIVYPDTGHDLRNVGTGEPVDLWTDLRSWLNENRVLQDSDR
jgi:dienelactone hydrolase